MILLDAETVALVGPAVIGLIAGALIVAAATYLFHRIPGIGRLWLPLSMIGAGLAILVFLGVAS